MNLSSSEPSQNFYREQYARHTYAPWTGPSNHPFYDTLQNLLDTYGGREGKWLDVGCGRGALQDVVEDYTGVDIVESLAENMHKPFRTAPAEHLPFPDETFDGLWTYAVLEHVERLETAVEEMIRVLKPGGRLFLAPAWQCRSWAGKDYAWKSFSDLSARDRIRKALIPLRNHVVFRAWGVFPRRLLHAWIYRFSRHPQPFRARELAPNYSEYRVADADARFSMDPFDAGLWFVSRGHLCLSHPSWHNLFFVRTGALVIEKKGRAT